MQYLKAVRMKTVRNHKLFGQQSSWVWKAPPGVKRLLQISRQSVNENPGFAATEVDVK
jgi:hypothetical protein